MAGRGKGVGRCGAGVVEEGVGGAGRTPAPLPLFDTVREE